jgi:hypothetical protein
MTISNIPEYLEHHRREYLTDEFAFSSYNAPNTMYQVSNHVDEILLTVSFHAIKMWHRSLSLIKRSKDPSLACSLAVSYSEYSDILSRNYYYKALNELLDKDLLFKTTDKHVFVINIMLANKLYKPKLDI